MKIVLLLIFCTFAVIASANDEDINMLFNQESGSYWQYISDRTMGGISDGEAFLEQDGEIYFARLKGSVSTKNNGGFIQIRSTFSFSSIQQDEKKIKGVKINVRGNGETYYIFIRTNMTQSYSDFYLASFRANSKWETIDLPFDKFQHRFLNNTFLQDKEISTFALAAYGRDFISDVSISKIIFYY